MCFLRKLGRGTEIMAFLFPQHSSVFKLSTKSLYETSVLCWREPTCLRSCLHYQGQPYLMAAWCRIKKGSFAHPTWTNSVPSQSQSSLKHLLRPWPRWHWSSVSLCLFQLAMCQESTCKAPFSWVSRALAVFAEARLFLLIPFASDGRRRVRWFHESQRHEKKW